MASRLIIEGNAVYEIDEECYSRKMEAQDAARKNCGREAREGETAWEWDGCKKAGGEAEPVQCQEQ